VRNARYHRKLPDGRRAFERCVADVARHESTDENPAITLQPSPARHVPANETGDEASSDRFWFHQFHHFPLCAALQQRRSDDSF
jgi:hypothetical protein